MGPVEKLLDGTLERMQSKTFKWIPGWGDGLTVGCLAQGLFRVALEQGYEATLGHLPGHENAPFSESVKHAYNLLLAKAREIMNSDWDNIPSFNDSSAVTRDDVIRVTEKARAEAAEKGI